MDKGINVSNKDVNVLALVKGTERYVFIYDGDNKFEALRSLNRYSCNPNFDLNFHDSAVLSAKLNDGLSGDENNVYSDKSDRMGWSRDGTVYYRPAELSVDNLSSLFD